MEKGKRLYESFKIACSMYSKLPVPQSDWTEENMRYVMCFFPWIGAVIGLFFAGVWNVKEWLASCGIYYHELFYAAILTVLPIFVTGGIHMDGFLDTCDALSSWQEKERRLEILKDSHAGAFAILSCAVYLILTCGAMTSLRTELIPVVGLGFFDVKKLKRTFYRYFSDGKRKRTCCDVCRSCKKEDRTKYNGRLFGDACSADDCGRKTFRASGCCGSRGDIFLLL